MSKRLAAALLALAVSLLVGCATPPQAPIALSTDYFSPNKSKPGRIGVLMLELPKADTSFPGAGCLLCLAVAYGNHSTLTKEVQALGTGELKPLPADLVLLLKKQGVDAVLLEDNVRFADLPDLATTEPTKTRKNFAALKAKHKVDRLLVVNVSALGVWRSYSAYVPTDVPKAVLYGDASLIDLNTNVLEWYLPLALSRGAEGAWDEPPKFPGLSNAYYQVLETGMDMVKRPFIK